MHGLNNLNVCQNRLIWNLKISKLLPFKHSSALCQTYFEICSGISMYFPVFQWCSRHHCFGLLRGWPFKLKNGCLVPLCVGREAPQHEVTSVLGAQCSPELGCSTWRKGRIYKLRDENISRLWRDKLNPGPNIEVSLFSLHI